MTQCLRDCGPREFVFEEVVSRSITNLRTMTNADGMPVFFNQMSVSTALQMRDLNARRRQIERNLDWSRVTDWNAGFMSVVAKGGHFVTVVVRRNAETGLLAAEAYDSLYARDTRYHEELYADL